MTIELIEKKEINGKTMYNIYANNSCQESFYDKYAAIRAYEEYVDRVKDGYPKEEVLKSIEIPNK